MRRQAITWANVDPDLWCHMAPLGHSELTLCVLNWFEVKWKYNFAFCITAHHWSLQIMFILPLMRDHLKFKTILKSGLCRGVSIARRSSDTSFIVFITVPLILNKKCIWKSHLWNDSVLIKIISFKWSFDSPQASHECPRPARGHTRSYAGPSARDAPGCREGPTWLQVGHSLCKSQEMGTWVTLCFGLVQIKFTHILQGYFTGTVCQWSNPEGCG